MNGPSNFLLLAAVFLGLGSGCSLKSRYAMDDPVYAEKYADGAEKDDPLGKLKQAFDARHTEQLAGYYVSGGAQVRDEDTVLGGAELGIEGYPTNWMTARAALAIYGNDGEGYGGLDLGVRFQPPSRIAPFVGLGLFNGGSKGVRDADFDGADNDDDGLIDERGETRSTLDGWTTAIYPEVGVHAWINGRTRISGFGRYFITTHGRDDDHWLIGGQVTIFHRN